MADRSGWHSRSRTTRSIYRGFQVFGYNFEPGTNLVNVHIANLRKKLRGGPVVIEAVRGVGYRLRPREPGDA